MSSTNAATAGSGGEQDTIDINDQDIRAIQELRKGFISGLTVGGKLPSDPEDRATLLALMSQTTNTALASKKIKADEKSSTSNAVLVQSMADAIRSATANASAARRAGIDSSRERVKRSLDVEEVTVKLVPGNTDIGCYPISTTSIANGGDGSMER